MRFTWAPVNRDVCMEVYAGKDGCNLRDLNLMRYSAFSTSPISLLHCIAIGVVSQSAVPGVCTILSDDPKQPDRSSTYFCIACLSRAVNPVQSGISLISFEILPMMK